MLPPLDSSAGCTRAMWGPTMVPALAPRVARSFSLAVCGLLAATALATGSAVLPPGALVAGSAHVHRPAAPSSAWQRTRCGSAASPGTDIISSFGATVTPDNVKTIFGYPRPQMTRPAYHSLNGLWEFQPVAWRGPLAPPAANPPNCRGAGNCDGVATHAPPLPAFLDGRLRSNLTDCSCVQAKPPFGVTLNQTVLVPFPVESCLSGLENASLPGSPPTYQRMAYRTLIDGGLALEEAAQADAGGDSGDDGSEGDVLLHFGAVDWQADVYVNGLWVGSHEGGYDAFTFPIGDALRSTRSPTNNLIAYD